MALIVGTNTYVSQAEADSYFANRYGASSIWEALTDEIKEQLLVSASQSLDIFCEWKGYKLDENQALAFPRDYETEVSDSIKIAQYELSFAIYENGSFQPETSKALKSLKADTVQLVWNDSSITTDSVYNKIVSKYLKPFCLYSGSKKVIRV